MKKFLSGFILVFIMLLSVPQSAVADPDMNDTTGDGSFGYVSEFASYNSALRAGYRHIDEYIQGSRTPLHSYECIFVGYNIDYDPNWECINEYNHAYFITRYEGNQYNIVGISSDSSWYGAETLRKSISQGMDGELPEDDPSPPNNDC